jgi:hypothetical protein
MREGFIGAIRVCFFIFFIFFSKKYGLIWQPIFSVLFFLSQSSAFQLFFLLLRGKPNEESCCFFLLKSRKKETFSFLKTDKRSAEKKVEADTVDILE